MAAAGVMAALEVSQEHEAAEPPEARGLRRDEVRLLVSDIAHDAVAHAQFRDLPQWIAQGDLLVVNTNATLNAAVAVTADNGAPFELHLSTRLPGGFWSVELHERAAVASMPSRAARSGLDLRLPDGARATLLAPYPLTADLGAPSRLWIAALHVPGSLHDYLTRHGEPIRCAYVPTRWPASMYQTVFATEPGSAEMPCAGRPFTPELVTRLVARGVQFAPILLHAGVASLEHHEPPYEEYLRVPLQTAERVNAVRRTGHRVIAVGTTVERALETVCDPSGTVHPGEGWTSLVITAATPLRSLDSLITGLHEPRATHLAMLERVVDRASRSTDSAVSAGLCGGCQLERAYEAALAEGYLWHEFGDSHLILGSGRRPSDLTIGPTGPAGRLSGRRARRVGRESTPPARPQR